MSNDQTGGQSARGEFSPIAGVVGESLADAIDAAVANVVPDAAETSVQAVEKPAIPETITKLWEAEAEFMNGAKAQLDDLSESIEQAGFSQKQLAEIAPDIMRVKKALGLVEGGYARTKAEQKVAITSHLSTLAKVIDFHATTSKVEGPAAPAA